MTQQIIGLIVETLGVSLMAVGLGVAVHRKNAKKKSAGQPRIKGTEVMSTGIALVVIGAALSLISIF